MDTIVWIWNIPGQKTQISNGWSLAWHYYEAIEVEFSRRSLGNLEGDRRAQIPLLSLFCFLTMTGMVFLFHGFYRNVLSGAQSQETTNHELKPLQLKAKMSFFSFVSSLAQMFVTVSKADYYTKDSLNINWYCYCYCCYWKAMLGNQIKK